LRRKPRQSRKLGRQQPLWQTVRRYLEQSWSPEQIAGRLKKDYPEQPDLPSIHLRPPEADERLVPGHWEGNFLKGAANRTAVGTLVDRMSLFVMVVKMEPVAPWLPWRVSAGPLPRWTQACARHWPTIKARRWHCMPPWQNGRG